MLEMSDSQPSNNRKQRPAPPPPPPPPSQSKIPPAQSPTVADSTQQQSSPSRPPAPPRPPRKANHETVPIEVALEHVMSLSGRNSAHEEAEPLQSAVADFPQYPSVVVEDAADVEAQQSEVNPFTAPTVSSLPSLQVENNASKYSRVSEASPTTFRPTSVRASEVRSNAAASNRTPPVQSSFFLSPDQLGSGDRTSQLYHKNRLSEWWLVVFIILLILQFVLLLTVGFEPLPKVAFAILLLLVLACLGCAMMARLLVTKSRLSAERNLRLRGNVLSPEAEADEVPDRAVYYLAAGSVILGVTFALFTSILAGSDVDLSSSGFFTQDTLLQTLRFASIVLLALHRTMRPANRIDPMRTIMELEVVTVCWDAIDGSTLYELLDNSSDLSPSLQTAIRFLMAFWYFSVGVRMAIMLLTHLSPQAWGNRMLLTAPFQLAPQPTVDRTLQGLRLRALVVMTMACADFYAAALRLYMWSNGQLDALQQDMAVKNVVFLITFSGAYTMFENTITRQWNARQLLSSPLDIKYPSRERQLVLCRWLFVASHMTIGILLSYVLIVVNDDMSWLCNILLDAVLCVIFLVYAHNIDRKADAHDPTICLAPRKEFFAFPARMGAILGILLGASLFLARIPALYYNYPSLNNYADDTLDNSSLFSYNNAMMLVVLMSVPIALYSSYWTVGYMLFRKEFTASPGNYNSIHDPVINMVATFTMTEGALDVLSCATLLQLAANDLPSNVNNAIVMFCILEMVNACQSFALQCTLAGGHNDTPLDLVKWMAYMRGLRTLIDAGAIVLRVVLWVQYNAVSSVFLVKNLYNLLHTSTQIERYQGVRKYPKETLFSEFVTPQDWYNMTKEEWRLATKDTLTAQARSGRRV